MLQDFIKSKGEKPASNAEKRREQALRLIREEKENDLWHWHNAHSQETRCFWRESEEAWTRDWRTKK